ncbi:MAG: hypothetical protein V4533_14865 [Pseudomonadota bacterium]|jgi:hypothetical protein|tara:strand:- start:54 stop:200 length:147 start_codon:yes stop_codon:yes gene_type:complete
MAAPWPIERFLVTDDGASVIAKCWPVPSREREALSLADAFLQEQVLKR